METIEFYEDEEEGLPAPMTRGDVLILNKAQQDGEADGAAEPAAAANGGTVRTALQPVHPQDRAARKKASLQGNRMLWAADTRNGMLACP